MKSEYSELGTKKLAILWVFSINVIWHQQSKSNWTEKHCFLATAVGQDCGTNMAEIEKLQWSNLLHQSPCLLCFLFFLLRMEVLPLIWRSTSLLRRSCWHIRKGLRGTCKLLHHHTEGPHTYGHLQTSYLFILLLLLSQFTCLWWFMQQTLGLVFMFLYALPSTYTHPPFHSFSNFPFSGLSLPTPIPCTILLKSIKTLVSLILNFKIYNSLCKLDIENVYFIHYHPLLLALFDDRIINLSVLSPRWNWACCDLLPQYPAETVTVKSVQFNGVGSERCYTITVLHH